MATKTNKKQKSKVIKLIRPKAAPYIQLTFEYDNLFYAEDFALQIDNQHKWKDKKLPEIKLVNFGFYESLVFCELCGLVAKRFSVDQYSPPAYKYYVQSKKNIDTRCEHGYIKHIIE